MIFVNLLAKQIATTKVFNKNIQICKYFLFTIIIEAFNDLIIKNSFCILSQLMYLILLSKFIVNNTKWFYNRMSD